MKFVTLFIISQSAVKPPDPKKVFSRQPFLPQAKRMSGSAVQNKQLQRFPHAYSVQVVCDMPFEPMGKPIGYNPARLQRAYLPHNGNRAFL